ncbi:hypothetical protein ABVT39_020006 [Epinephelus coioides]
MEPQRKLKTGPRRWNPSGRVHRSGDGSTSSTSTTSTTTVTSTASSASVTLMASNMSSAQPPKNDQVAIGDWLSSRSSEYQVQSFLGQGAFGMVAKCMRKLDKKTVAIKMMKNREPFIKQANNEVAALKKLRCLDPEECNIVHWHQDFICRNHICFMFEHLDKSLFDFMKERHFQPLLLKEIRPIVQQLAIALQNLKAVGIIHADLKLENVMLVNHAREPYRVKVIDFGLASDVSAARVGSYIQTRPYRSPEVILGLPFTEAIDMWSLGCMAASLYLGCLLYPGRSEYDMMRYIVETQGQPPNNVLTLGQKTGLFFEKFNNSTTRLYKLKTPEQYHAETGVMSVESRRVKLKSLNDLLNIRTISSKNSADKVAELNDLRIFVDMLKRMLHLDASERITPHQVLKHHFISMCHIINMKANSAHVQSCLQMMAVCQKKTRASSPPSLSGSQKQPTSSSGNCVQQNPASCSAERSCLSQTSDPVKSGMKRKVYDQDESRHPYKRVKTGWHRDKDAGPSNSSRSRDSRNDIQPSTAVRSPRAQPLHPHTNEQPCSLTQGCIRPGMKRKTDDEDLRHLHLDSDHYKRSDDDRKRFRRSHVGASASSSSRDSCNYIQPHTAVRSPRAQPLHPHTNEQPCSSSLTQGCIRPRMKRKSDDEDLRHRQLDSDYYRRSDDDRKRFRRSHAGSSASSSSSCTQRCISTPVKGKMCQRDDCEDYEGSGRERKRARLNIQPFHLLQQQPRLDLHSPWSSDQKSGSRLSGQSTCGGWADRWSHRQDQGPGPGPRRTPKQDPRCSKTSPWAMEPQRKLKTGPRRWNPSGR